MNILQTCWIIVKTRND